MTDTQSGLLVAPDFSTKSALPAFGRLCSAYAVRLGFDEMALASESQKQWPPAAKQAISDMHAAGAPVSPLQLLVFETRPGLKMIEMFARWAGFGIEKPAFSLGLMSADISYRTKNGEKPSEHADIFEYSGTDVSGMLLIQESNSHGRRTLHRLECLMGPHNARIAISGHEAGHFVQIVDHFDLARDALRAVARHTETLLPVTRDFALRCEANFGLVAFGFRPPSDAEGQIIQWLDESIADAYSAWAAEMAGVQGAAKKLADWRHQDARRTPAVYATEWLLDSLSTERSLPRDHQEFKAVLGAHLAANLIWALQLRVERRHTLRDIQALRGRRDLPPALSLRNSGKKESAADIIETKMRAYFPDWAKNRNTEDPWAKNPSEAAVDLSQRLTEMRAAEQDKAVSSVNPKSPANP